MEVGGPGHHFVVNSSTTLETSNPHKKIRESFQASLISVIYGESLQVQLGVFSGVPGSIAVHFPLPGSLDAALQSKTAVLRRLVVGIVLARY